MSETLVLNVGEDGLGFGSDLCPNESAVEYIPFRRCRPSVVARKASAMAVGIISHPTPAGEEINSKEKQSMGGEEGQNVAKDSHIESGEGSKRGQRKPGQCLPKSWIILEMIVKLDGLEFHIQYMKDNALLAKFVGIWLLERALVWWINNT